MPLPSSSFYPTAASSPSLSAAPLARASTSPTLPPFSSCSCSLFLLGRPHRAFSSTVRVREHGERLFVSYRLVSLDSFLSPPPPALTSLSLSPLSVIFSLSASPLFFPSFFFLFSLSFLPILSFRRLFLRPPPTLFAYFLSPSLAVDSLSARVVRYKLFQKFVLLLLSLNHSQHGQRRALESSTMRDSVRAPSTTSTRRRRR